MMTANEARYISDGHDHTLGTVINDLSKSIENMCSVGEYSTTAICLEKFYNHVKNYLEIKGYSVIKLSVSQLDNHDSQVSFKISWK